MTTLIVLEDVEKYDSTRLTRTGSILDLSIACKRVREHLESINPEWRIVYASIEELGDVAKKIDDNLVVLLDAYSLYTRPGDVISDMLSAYAASATDILVAVSTPILRRGFSVTTRDSRLAELGGAEAFAGIIVARRSRLERVDARSWPELLSTIRGSSVYYVTAPWVRVENPYDVLVYELLLLSDIRETRISSNARISPTAVIEGPVIIAKGATIDHYAVIKGPAVICENSFVGLHATVRSFTLLEPSARIGAYGEAYVAYIGRYATLSSHVYVTGSVIGEAAKVEPFSLTKVVYGKRAVEKIGLVAPFSHELRLGAVIESGARVTAGSILEPLTIVKTRH